MDAATFLEKVIKRLIWDTGREGSSGIRYAVIARLEQLTIKQGLDSSRATGLDAVLFAEVADIAKSKEHVALTAAVLIEKAMGFFQPHLAATTIALMGSVVTGTSELTLGSELVGNSDIRIPESFSRREGVVNDIAGRFGATATVILKGSTGMGKTILAQLCSIQVGGAWIQISLEDDLGQSLRGLRECIRLIDSYRGRTLGFIIDDLPWEKFTGGAANSVRAFAYAVRRSGGRMLFSCERPPASVDLVSLELDNAAIVEVPAMEKAEIREAAVRMGCSDPGISDEWAGLIEIQTEGHPQLAQVQLLRLKQRNWPRATAEEIRAAYTVISGEKARSQRLLAARSVEEVELLLRLSGFLRPFRRDQALHLAAAVPAVPKAAPSFEQLNGPWIEDLAGGYFRLSPLLPKLAATDEPADRKNRLNRAIIRAVLETKPVYYHDAAGALRNAIEAEADEDALRILHQFLLVPKRHARSVRDLLLWTLSHGLDGSKVFRRDPAADAFFKLFQFLIVAQIEPDSSALYLARLDEAITAVSDNGKANLLRGLIAFEFMDGGMKGIPLVRVFAGISVVKTMARSAQAAADVPRIPLPRYLRAANREEELEAAYGLSILSQNRGIEFIAELLEMLRTASQSDREEHLRILARCRPMVLLAFDRAWLAEEKKNLPDWKILVALFREFFDSAKIWKDELLQVASARSISIIESEYLKNEEAAFAVLDELKLADQALAALVLEQRGKIEWFAKRFATAQFYLEAAIGAPELEAITNRKRMLLFQCAGAAAGHAGDWAASARNFESGRVLAAADDDWTSAFGLAADAGYALWEAGDKEGAIECFARCLKLSPKLPDHATDLLSLKAQKTFGNMLLRLAWRPSGRLDEEYAGPIIPGFCSDPTPFPGLRELPAPQMDVLWAFLLTIEFEHSESAKYWNEYEERLSQLPHPSIRQLILELRARHALRDGRFDDLLSIGIDTGDEFWLIRSMPTSCDWATFRSERAARPSGNYSLEELFSIPMLLLCGLTMAQFRGVNRNRILDAWETASRGVRLEGELREWIAKIRVCLALVADEAYKELIRGENYGQSWASALRILEEPAAAVEHLQALTIFFALLNSRHPRLAWWVDTIVELDEQVSRRWKRACTNNRYAFKRPTLFVPDILALANGPDGTPKHLAKLALTAGPAVKLGMSQSVVEQLKKASAEA